MKKTGEIINELEERLGFYKRLVKTQDEQIHKLKQECEKRGMEITLRQIELDQANEQLRGARDLIKQREYPR